jgi:hypothetical protein
MAVPNTNDNAILHFYKLTFGGEVFLQKGGYDQELKDNKIKRNRDIVYTLSVAIGTALAGLYGLFEILKLLLSHIFHCK